MRTHVGKMLVGVGLGVGTPVAGEWAVAPWAAIQALLTSGTTLPAAAASDEFGYVQAVADPLGGTVNFITSGPFSSANSIVEQNPYDAAVQQVTTVTVDVTDMVDGKAYIIKVVYHDNLSIIPNQMKFTTVSVVYLSTMTATLFADAVTAAFNAQDFIFVSVANTAGVITFTGLVLQTASAYNRIDRPEMVVFEVGVGDMTYGSYITGIFVVATSQAAELGQGSAAQIAWMEDNHQGRRGYADRRMWNNTKKFVPSAVAGTTYHTFIVTDDKNVEGDMQNIRHNPIGATMAATSATAAAVVTATNTIISTNAINVIQHPVDS